MATKIEKFTDKPKPPNAGKGRPAGVPNKVTGAFRETVNRVLSDNAENVSQWLSQVAAEDPAKALDLITKLAEYAVPKLSRQDVQAQVTDTTGPSRIEIVAATEPRNLSGEDLRRELQRRGLPFDVFKH